MTKPVSYRRIDPDALQIALVTVDWYKRKGEPTEGAELVAWDLARALLESDAALTDLAERLEAAEEQNGDLQRAHARISDWEEEARFWKYEQTEASKELVARAEAAESLNAELVEALEAIADDGNISGLRLREAGMQEVARNALAKVKGTAQ